MSWQNIWNSRQIATIIAKKFSSLGEFLSWRDQSYLPYLIKQMETMSGSYQQSAMQSQNGAENFHHTREIVPIKEIFELWEVEL